MDEVDEFVGNLTNAVLDPLIALLVGIAIVIFLAGIFRFLTNSTNAEERQLGIKHMIWGFVGFLIIYLAQGILNLIQNTVNGL